MAETPALEQMVVDLVPSLSRSLAEQFNVFRVMHHGTHEKQLSNVFAWLLRTRATHDLGDVFQRILIEHIARNPSHTGLQLPVTGYQVTQEVDTAGHDAAGKDIADIVLTTGTTRIVVENFESSDGHGHDYERYLAYGRGGGRQSVVVLLCGRREPNRQIDGWQHAAVITYAELLADLQVHITRDARWSRSHPEQLFFINQLIDHFVEGTGAVSDRDRISFIKAMCDTGESARYGYRPQENAAQEFADLLAQHAKRQFDEGRSTLGRIKRALRGYAEETLAPQLNARLVHAPVTSVTARFVGQWEWSVTLRRENVGPRIFLEFGPTAVVENGRAPEPIQSPDYTKVFVTRNVDGGGAIDRIIETTVGLDEVLDGLASEDTRLRDAVLSIAGDVEAGPMSATDALGAHGITEAQE